MMSKHVTAIFKGFASDVSMSFSDLLNSVTETAKKLVLCESIKVFLRNPNGKGFFTLMDNVEDEEDLETFELEGGTLVSKTYDAKRVIILNHARDARIWSDDRDANASVKSAMCAPMTTSFGEVVGLVVWINKRSAQRHVSKEAPGFTPSDEFAAKFFALFAAVSMMNTTRIQNINELRAESNLQAVPPIKLGRITIRGGWSTVRRGLKRLIAMGRERRRTSVAFLAPAASDPTQSIIPFDAVEQTNVLNTSDFHLNSSSTHPNASMMTSVAMISKKLFEPRKRTTIFKDNDESQSMTRHSEESEEYRRRSTVVTFTERNGSIDSSAPSSTPTAAASPFSRAKSALKPTNNVVVSRRQNH